MPHPAKPSAHDRLLRAAAELFYANGVAATGIDRITAHAGVAKQSLYNNFDSKTALIAAYLDARHVEWLAIYETRAEQATTPEACVLAVFDAYIDHAATAYTHGFRGCGLLNAAAELAADDPGRVAVRRHKLEVERLLQTQAAARYPDDPPRATTLAQHCAFLLEGAMARAGLDGDPACLHAARAMAADMLARP